jgi:vacuolar-type H+-ATPase subunit I/STV1
MTNEEMQKAMEFMVQQQAQASAKIDGILEAQKAAEQRWTRTEEGIHALLSIAEIHEREIVILGQKVEKVGEKIAEVNENGRATDERLNALINIVERQITEGRNGKP